MADDRRALHRASSQRDIAELNVLPAHVYPRATEEIPAIIEMIEGLIAKGYAYAGPPRGRLEASDVYYRVEKKADYGKLSKRSLESMLAGARIEPLEGKENPMDFTLWKAAKPGEPSWDSPWGQGRPGWHIECSAMSLRHLGTADRHPRRRPRPRLPPPRERDRPDRGVHRRWCRSRASGCTTACCSWATRR